MKILDTTIVTKIKKNEIIVIILISTGFSMVMSILILVGSFYPYHISITICDFEMLKFIRWDEVSNLVFEITIQTIGFIIPFVVLLFSNLKILLFVRILLST